MARTVSNERLRKYKVLRLLWTGRRRYDYLVNHCDEEQRRVIQTLQKLHTLGDVKKEKIHLNDDEKLEISTSKIIADLMGVDAKTKKKFITAYSLTKNGINKLCYFEFYFGIHELWVPAGFEGYWQEQYKSEVDEKITKQGFYIKKMNASASFNDPSR